MLGGFISLITTVYSYLVVLHVHLKVFLLSLTTIKRPDRAALLIGLRANRITKEKTL